MICYVSLGSLVHLYLWLGSRKGGASWAINGETDFQFGAMLAASNEAMQTAPAFLLSSSPFLALERGGRERERAGGEDVAAFNFLSPFCTEARLFPLFHFPIRVYPVHPLFLKKESELLELI